METSLQKVKTAEERQLGTILVIISATGFGLLAIFVKFAYGANLNLLTILSLRFLIAAVFLWAFVFIKKEDPRVESKQLLALFALGAMGYGLMSSFFFYAVKLIPAAVASMMLYSYPVIVTMLSAWLYKEAITRNKIASLLISSLGLVLVVGVVFQGVNMKGLFFGGMAALVYSVYIVLSNKLVGKINSLVMTAYVITSAAIAFNIVGWLTGSVTLAINTQGWLAILAIALISTVVAIIAFFQGMKLVGPSKTCIISTMEPVITTLAAFLFFAETITMLQVLGGSLIIAAVILVQKDI